MRSLASLVALLWAGSLPGVAVAEEGGSSQLRVLYVRNTQTDRGRAYARFLGEHYSLRGAEDRKTFDPKAAKAAAVDVVVLDWSQSDMQHSEVRDPAGFEARVKSPLGPRNQWRKPTVLLGSAGHLLAAPWKVFGGSG